MLKVTIESTIYKNMIIQLLADKMRGWGWQVKENDNGFTGTMPKKDKI